MLYVLCFISEIYIFVVVLFFFFFGLVFSGLAGVVAFSCPVRWHLTCITHEFAIIVVVVVVVVVLFSLVSPYVTTESIYISSIRYQDGHWVRW